MTSAQVVQAARTRASGPVVAVGFLVAYVALNELARLFSSGDVVFLWYPPAALTLALLWLGRPVHLWLAVGAAAFCTCLDLTLWDEPWRSLPFALGNAVAYAAGGLLLRRLRADPTLGSRRDALVLFFAGGLLTTLLAAWLGVAGFWLAGLVDGDDVLSSVGRFWIGDVAGVTTFGPALMLLLTRSLHLRQTGESRGRAWERAGTLLVVSGCAYLSAAAWSGQLSGWGDGEFQPMTLVIVPMVWVALRERLAVVAVAVLAVNVICLGVGAEHANTVGRALTLQIAVATTALVGLALATSVTLRLEAETGRAHDALHDPLTGLPNELLFCDRVALALRQAREDGATTGVLSLGLDGFGAVNDSLGRAGGDQLLRAVAWRVATDLPGGGTVARLGGDRFGILLDHRQGQDEAAALAERLLLRLQQPVHVLGQDVYARASLGVATCVGGSRTAEELCQDADSALRRAKESGGGRAELQDAEHGLRARRRLVLERELRARLAEGADGLVLHYQPLVDARSGEVVGHEALLRWTSPELGPVPPPEVVALAESAGLGRLLLQGVLRSACAQAAALPGTSRMAVNVSALQLSEPGVVEDVQEALAAHGLAPARLVLEITETGLVEQEHVVPRLSALRARGVRISLDDFGTGYSSLAYLTKLPVDELKVDQSFVRELPDGQAALAVVQATLSMARALGLEVVAEGVEEPHQAQALTGLGCTLLQGYLFGRPGPVATTAVLPDQRTSGTPEPA